MYVRVHSMACLELVNLLPFFGGSDMYSIYMYKQIAYQVQRFWRSNLENFTRISPVLTLNQNRPSKTYHEAIYIYTTVYLVGGFSPTQKWKTCKYVKLDHETPRIGWTSKKLKPTNQIYIYIRIYLPILFLRDIVLSSFLQAWQNFIPKTSPSKGEILGGKVF